MAPSTHARVPAWSRRGFLSAIGVGSALMLAGRGGGIRAATGEREYPFTLGGGSGEPSSAGFVIRMRLAPDSFTDVAAYPYAVVVDWEIAEDERTTRIVRRGSAIADSEWACLERARPATRARTIRQHRRGRKPPDVVRRLG